MTTSLDKVLNEISAKAGKTGKRNAIVGLDGFVDKIIQVVDKRFGQGEDFSPITLIEEFGQRIVDAAGKSANFELFQVMEKIGGNGPIMANALLSQQLNVRYIGVLGIPVHPVFGEFAARTRAVSLGDPGTTQALEFDDGKLMFGNMGGLEKVTYDNMVAIMGEGELFDAFNRAHLIALVNWTMVPYMTGIFESLLTRLLPNLGPSDEGRFFFFDLADPAKRSVSDLKMILQTISRFRSFGHTVLGLNLAECKQVCKALDLGKVEDNEGSLKSAVTRIRSTLELGTVVVHPRASAACATRNGSWFIEGPYCSKPRISTGAGDHFNAGFASALTLGMSPLAALTIGAASSGQYVRTARSPSLQQSAIFIDNWIKGSIPS